jgi:uncharacterized protein involved in exopolysaccharide biosynthesis
VGFRHPNPAVAANLANALADEFIRQLDALNNQKVQGTVTALQAQADEQRKRIDSLQAEMDEITQKYGVTNIDATSTTVFVSAIEELNKKVIQNKATMDELVLRIQQIQEQLKDGKPLLDLNFLSSQPHIVSLEQTVQTVADQYKQLLTEGYADDAPILTEAKGRVEEADQQLKDGVVAAAKQVAADLEVAQNNYAQSVDRLANMQKQTQDLSQQRAKYDALRQDLDTAQQMYSKQQLSIADTQTNAKLNAVTYTIVARAEAPPAADPLPWLSMGLTSLGWGLAAGVLALAGFAILLPPPAEQHQEYERRRRRHRHFHSSSSRR